MSLLANALQFTKVTGHHTSEASQEMVDLAVAYATHDVSLKQVAYALYPEEMDKAIDKPAEVQKLASRATQKMQHAYISAIRTGKLVPSK